MLSVQFTIDNLLLVKDVADRDIIRTQNLVTDTRIEYYNRYEILL